MLELLVVALMAYVAYRLIRKAATRTDRGDRTTDLGTGGKPTGAPSGPVDRPAGDSHGRGMAPTPSVTTKTSRPWPVRRGPAQWIPAGQEVEIHGYTIPGGMLYVGAWLPSVSAPHTPDPALINPALPVRRLSTGRPTPQLPYWPSYSAVSPEARGVYLEWLARGRKDEIDIGYVFLFFYGLERRVLLNRMAPSGHRDVSDEELAQIAHEVRRLLSLYGSNRSFYRYATGFLGVCEFLLGANDLQHPPDLDDGARTEPPLSLKLGLGLLAAQGRPIPADWALAWLQCDPEYRPRTAALRCRDEFRHLFAIRYEQTFGGRLVIRPNKASLTIQYRPASASFSEVIRIRSDIPDVTALRTPLAKIRNLADECADALDPYSRWLARTDGNRHPIMGIGLLPRELQGRIQSQEVAAYFAPIEAALADRDIALLDASVLLKGWPTTTSGRLRKQDAVLLADLMAVRGFGIVPDVRFDAEVPSVSGMVAVFRGGPAMPSTPSPEYASAALLIRFATMLVLADQEVNESERRHLRQMIARMRLDSTERRRLEAYLEWLLNRPVQASWRSQLKSLPVSQQRTIAKFFISVAAADGRLTKSEIDILRRIYGAIELGEEQLYSDLHTLSSGVVQGAIEPVPVAQPEAVTAYRIPPMPTGDKEADHHRRPTGQASLPTIRLDMERVRRKIIETAQVSQLLSAVFLDDDGTSEPTGNPGLIASSDSGTEESRTAGGSSATAPGAASADPKTGSGRQDLFVIPGLDASHVKFLDRLTGKTAWPRAEIEDIASEYGLLLDGAVELLNEVAFERYGCPLLEGDDPIEVDQDCLAALIHIS